jgi:hypothetical protein
MRGNGVEACLLMIHIKVKSQRENSVIQFTSVSLIIYFSLVHYDIILSGRNILHPSSGHLYPEDGSTMFLQNFGIEVPASTGS